MTWTGMRVRLVFALALLVGCSAPNKSGGSGGTGGSDAGVGGANLNGGSGPLNFAVFGDARPPNADETTSYPSTILSGIFSMAKAKGASFMIGTGDYMYADSQAAVDAQIALFKQAEANFTNPIYLGMGNHECNGYTDSNCPLFNEYPNVKAYMEMLPATVKTPYYRIDFDTPAGKAKLIFVAANAWSTTQEAWLTAQLADATKYTFVIRHEPYNGPHDTAPGAGPSEMLLAPGNYTLELLGHTHEYKRTDTTHVISGNAGAPISGGGGYGFLLVEQLADETIQVSEYDEATGDVTDMWKVNADGSGAS